ncbi:hypothetical protein CAC42_7079 [Sphaceloma murrayae]|uniref:GST N-terminal domain-containing protein n=1 Tax=Sphaceloma murrayae TaxID=2082308 RepID=A0A2K1QQN3_9PEZI|nr:hypothetical protein CAC42_7079 [Sphaceloma murrayae]
MGEIILYDLPSRKGVAWSLNPWKTRMILNFKGLKYKTQWVEYPDVGPLMKSFGIPPNKAWPEYTIPVLKTEKGEYIMDSIKIAEHLESAYPPGNYASLKLNDPVQQRVVDALGKIMGAMAPIVMPLIPRNILNPPSAEYFQRTRKERFGMVLDDMEKEKGGEKAWTSAKEPIANMAAILNETEGPYFLGAKASYADVIFVTFLFFVKQADEKAYDRLVEPYPEFRDLYTVMNAYLDRATE